MKKTPLNPVHVTANARLIDFGGWHMPVQYTGVLDEHHCVRNNVGLFDVSHMGEITVKGPQSLDFLQYLLTNDISLCDIKQAQYNVMCYFEGGIVDDLIVYHIADDHYLLCVNASNIDKDFDWILSQSKSFDVIVENHSGNYAQIALQGPLSEKVLQKITNVELKNIKYYRFDEGRLSLEGFLDAVPAIIARTGYTGEDGFEIFIAPEFSINLWNALLEAGKDDGIKQIGLGARDTLRLEMKYPLYGNDIDKTTTPLEAGLSWVVKLGKKDFIGKSVLVEQKSNGLTRKLCGFELLDKGIARHGYEAYSLDGRSCGIVRSGSSSPSLSKSIGMVYLPLDIANIGSVFNINIRQKMAKAVVVKTPFYTKFDDKPKKT